MFIPTTALCFSLGVLSLQLFSVLPKPYWLVLLPLSFICGLFFLFSQSKRSSKISVFSLLAAVFVLGFSWALLHAQQHFAYQLPSEWISKDILVEGRISNIVQLEAGVQRFEMNVYSYGIKDAEYFPRQLRLSLYRSRLVIKGGQVWRFKVRLKPPHGFTNPGGFDYERWLYLRGVQATGYVRADKINLQLSTHFSLVGLRQAIFDELNTGHKNANGLSFSGVLAALMVGDKSRISAEQWQVFRNTGTSHLMAISGLHIGLVAGFVFWLVTLLCPVYLLKFFSKHQVAAFMAMLAGLFYALLAGFSVPTQRAWIMLLVVMSAVIFKRQINIKQVLSLALIAVLLIDPRSLLSAGFYLSFLAVMVITAGIYGRLGRATKMYRMLSIQWRLILALMPVSLLWFQQVSVIAIVANLILVPWVSLLVVPLALSSLVFMFVFDALAVFLITLANKLMLIIWPLLQFLAELPMATITRSEPSFIVFILSFFGVFLFLSPRGFPLRYLGFICFLPLIFVTHSAPNENQFNLTLLDVGQGLAVFIQTKNHSLMFDTGPSFGPNFNTGDRVLMPFLKYKGIGYLDKLIISHGDSDHIGGAASLLQNIKVLELYVDADSTLKHAYKNACIQGQSWQWDGIKFEILHPDKVYKQRNNNSCVLKISASKNSVLIAADIENKVEQRLLHQYPDKINVDVLIVPHHGSKTSSSTAFVAAVSPEYALISAGFLNRFKHPHKKVLAVYDRAGIEILNTANMGAIEMKFTENKIELLRMERQAELRYWY